MTIKYKADRVEGLSTDTKPSNHYNGRVFYETDTGNEFEYDGTTWNEAGGSTVSTNVVSAYDQVIGNYSIPSTATASSEGTASSTKNTADDMTGYEGATGIGTNGNDNNDSTNYLKYLTRWQDGTYTIGTWIFDSVFYVTSVTVKFSLEVTYVDSPHNNTYARRATLQYSTDNSTWTDITQIVRNTVGTTTVDGTYTINANARYFRVKSVYGSKSHTNYRLYYINVSGNIPESATNATSDDTTIKWTSTSETNPNIYIDTGSSQKLSGLAIHYNSDTTETEIKIQTSTDGSTWTDKRTINTSALTSNSWNYIRIPVTTARYIRIYGNSGSSTVLAINELKYLAATDSSLITSHGHLAIDATDSSLSLDGT